MFNQDGYSNMQRPEENTQDLYGLVFKHFNDPVFIVDGSLKLIETNLAGCGFIGYGSEEIAGTDFINLIHPQDRFLFDFSNAVEPGGKEIKAYRARLLKKDGTAVRSKLYLDRYSQDSIAISCRQVPDFISSDYFNQYVNIKDSLRASIDALPLWIACIDTEGKYFFANRHYSTTFKIPLKNIIGHYYKEFFPAGLYEKHKKLADECMGRGITVTFEDEADFGNGLKFQTYGIYTPLFDEDNAVFGMSAAVFDISERKELELRVNKAAADLKESEAKFRALVESSVCGIGISSGNKIIYANDALMKMYGYDDFKEFSSRDLIDYLTPESKYYLKNWRDKKQLGEKVPNEFEVEIIHRDKSIKTLLITVSELKIKNEILYQSTFIDITEIKKSEERIKEIAGRYECIVAASGQIAYDYNVITGEIAWGSTIEKILGYSLSEISCGFCQWTGLLHADDKAETLKKLSESEAGCSLFDAEYRLKHKAGHYVWVRDRGFFLPDGSGKAVRQLGMIEDITARKNAMEAIIRAREQAESAGMAKSLFIANMSHEIRTPMNGIIGFANLLSSSGLTLRQKEFNGIIKTSCEHLLGLIDDILDFSKIEANKLKLENSPFDIKSVLDNSIKAVSEQAELKKLKIETFLDERINYLINGDEYRIRQILVNLLTNSVKFTFSGKIGVKISQLSLNDGISTFSLTVYDTGIGIPGEKIGEIFEMFHQLDESSTKRHGGSGIGLSIVKGLVELMGGTISVESEVQKGSSFKVILNCCAVYK